VEKWLVNWDEEDSDDLIGGEDENGRGKPIGAAANDLDTMPRSPCVQELERILYRPPVCNPHRFSSLAAKLIIAAATSGYDFDIPFCTTFSQLNDVDVEILDSQGTPQCLAGPDVQVDDVILDAYFVLYTTLDKMTPAARVQVYTETFVLATGLEPSAGTFELPNGDINDMAGIFTVNSYLAQATNTANLLTSLQQIGAIETTVPVSNYQDQLDLSNFELITAYSSYVPVENRYTQIYLPVLALYNMTIPPNPDAGIETASFLYTLSDVLVDMDEATRSQQYPIILRTILQPSSLIYSFGLLEPMSLVVNTYCFYAFTLRSPDGNIFRVVLSQQQGAMYSTTCE
jgi:hypothetical protein